MLKRAIGLFLALCVVALVAFNFKHLLTFGQAHEIEQQANRYIAVKNWEKAIATYEQGQHRYTDNPDIAVKLGWLYLQNKQPEKAEALYQSALQQHPDNPELLLGLAHLLETQPNRSNEMINALRKALRASPNNTRLLAQIGNLYKDAAENPAETRTNIQRWLYTQALYYYGLSLKLHPRQLQTQFNVGVAHQNLNEPQEAAQAYCKALLLSPNSYESRFNLGIVLSDLDYLEEGYRQMDRAIQILSEQNDIATAQSLAVKVQNVKTRIYNSGQRGLSAPTDPPFLDQGCLYKAVPTPTNRDQAASSTP